MRQSTVLLLFLFLVTAGAAGAQDEASGEHNTPANAPVQRNQEILDYGDYTVKAYSLSFSGGIFSGGVYLDNQALGDKTRITEDGRPDELWPNDILGYNGLPLEQGRLKRDDGLRYLYDSGRKEIESGPAYTGAVGIYIADNFHLDVHGTYATGKAVTTMVYQGTDDNDPRRGTREVVDEDEGFSMIKGGLALMYDAEPATFWGITPRLGFGLGGIINSYTELADKTGLYLEGTFGLAAGVTKSLDVFGQVNVASFAFEVDELGYSNMVNYTTFSLGLGWFFDVLPPEVRAAHVASKQE